jgi:putative transcriptional regulator
MIGFAWDPKKAASNLFDHKVSFEQAAVAFRAPFAVEWVDDREEYERSVCRFSGYADARCFTWPTPSGAPTFGSSRPGGRRNVNKTDLIARMHRDGSLHQIMPDGTEVPMPVPGPLPPMSEAEIHAAALADRDAQPLTEADMARMKRVPRAKTLRRSLDLTQEEFAARFQIPLGTLRDWEQGRAEPDQPARAYLKVIAVDAQAVQRALEAVPQPPH